jgi:hypothetical protein
LEVDIIKDIAKRNNLDVFEAGTDFSPGSYAFCTKICSKIIISQICVIFLNAEYESNIETPNANVYMEYGLMLGHNKYIIPFQREGDKLPFNVSGLDTIKYNQSNFKEKAEHAIISAIEQTEVSTPPDYDIEQSLGTFLLHQNAMLASVDIHDERQIFNLGKPCGFNLLTDLSGMQYIFFGNFSALRKEMILWRVRKLQEILTARWHSIEERVQLGVGNEYQQRLIEKIFRELKIWIIVSTEGDRDAVLYDQQTAHFDIEVFTVEEILAVVEEL